jgi:hypothetical protein
MGNIVCPLGQAEGSALWPHSTLHVVGKVIFRWDEHLN